MFKKIFIINLLFFFNLSCKNNEANVVPEQLVNINFNYLPKSDNTLIVHHKAYTLSYLEDYEQSEWVAYELVIDSWKYNKFERPLFQQDKQVSTNSSHWKNYKKSGYTKGHLCPAGDRKQNISLYNETFLTSNVSPQSYAFNSGVWARLEDKVRYWAEKYNGLYVITGGVLEPNLKTIGFENVAVPKYFYKILLTKDKKKMIGFLVPHEKSNRPLYDFVVSIDSIEKLTKIDFFPALEDYKENEFEKVISYKNWAF